MPLYSVIPIATLFISLQKYFIKGLTVGAVKRLMKNLDINENKLHFLIQITDDGDVRFMDLSPEMNKGKLPPSEKEAQWYRLLEIQEAGMTTRCHHGTSYKGCEPGFSMKYKSHSDTRNKYGRILQITQEYDGLQAKSFIQFYDGIAAVRCWTELENIGTSEHVLEYVSSFTLTGIESEEKKDRGNDSELWIPHSAWFGEAQWKHCTLYSAGYTPVNHTTTNSVSIGETGTWSSCNYLPMGAITSRKNRTTYAWQIETSGSWNWEIGDKENHLYLQLSGPSAVKGNFTKVLKKGDKFATVPCAVTAVDGDFEKAIQELTKYRRVIRRPNKDNETPSVIFNDYMNCLMGDPTTEKLKPLIDAAARAGCKYFCVDCGWYDDGPWWDGVGEWLPAKKRFPRGIKEVLDYIKAKGMIPGLWLELEVIGIKCPLATQWDKDCFFQRHGKVIIDENRFQLDYRNPKVRAHADEVVKRLVEDYGAGYIKMDYNIDPGAGTDVNADSTGSGMLEHKRAYLEWLDSILERYPDLVFENCSSGGMRMEYSLLSRCAIQSVTDQEDYIKMAAIAANCATGATPEQAAIWSYPLKDGDEEEVIFNMVNALLFRIHQSGHLAQLSPERFALVKEGIDVFRLISKETSKGLPIWPTGLATMQDNLISSGIQYGNTIYLAVWCTKEDETFSIPLGIYTCGTKDKVNISCIYPSNKKTTFDWHEDKQILNVQLKAKTARLFKITTPV